MCALTKFYPGWFFNFLGIILTIWVNFPRIGEFLATALPSSAADEVSGAADDEQYTQKVKKSPGVKFCQSAHEHSLCREI